MSLPRLILHALEEQQEYPDFIVASEAYYQLLSLHHPWQGGCWDIIGVITKMVNCSFCRQIK